MKRRYFFTILLTALLGLIFADTASAMYHPGLGRFMQRDPNGTPIAPTARVGAASAAANGQGFIPRDPMPIQPQTQYTDGMNLYQYVGSNPVVYADPTGMWRYVGGMGSFEGSLGPDSDLKVASILDLNFRYNRDDFRQFKNDTCCKELRWVQIHRFDYDGRPWQASVNGARSRDTWYVDADNPPYYPHSNSVNPTTGLVSHMNDNPGLGSKFGAAMTRWVQDFEACLVCSVSAAGSPKGQGYGDVFGCIQWGHSFGLDPGWFSYSVTRWTRYLEFNTWSSSKFRLNDEDHETYKFNGVPGSRPTEDMARLILDRYFP